MDGRTTLRPATRGPVLHRALIAFATLAIPATLLASSPPPGAHTAPTSPAAPASDTTIPDDPFIRAMLKDPNDPTVKAFAAAQRVRVAEEQELKKLRFKYFRAANNTELRQIGIQKLREYTDPAVFPALLSVFKHDAHDVRAGILDHFADQQTGEADATLAWAAVFDHDAWFREQAAQRLLARSKETGEVSNRVKTVAAYGLRNSDDTIAGSAARLINTLNLIEAIPALINAQVPGGGNVPAADGGEAALAYILVGTQQAFVADLEPVVGDSAVGFDPELGIVTEGTYIRVIDAVVITYRTEIHYQLVDMADRNWSGSPSRSTASLSYDPAKWRDWYVKEFLPDQTSKRAAAEAKSPAPNSSPAPTTK